MSGSPVSPRPFPAPPATPQPGKSRSKILVIAIVVVIVASAILVVAYPSIVHHVTSPSQPPTPIFAFLPSSAINSTYGLSFLSYNDSGNLSSSSLYTSSGIVKGEMWLYGNNNSAYTSDTIATAILRMNSASAVSLFISNFTADVLKNSSSSPSFFRVSNGTFDNFVYSMFNASTNISAQVFIAHDGTFVLLMEFFGHGVLGKDMTVFNDQVKFMLPADSAPSPVAMAVPLSVAISGSVGGIPLSEIVTIILTFVAGLFIGLAIKKGIMAFVFAIIGFLIAGYVGVAFVPEVSMSYEIHKWSTFILTYVSTVKFGAIQLTLSVILFLIGLAIGLWKG